MHRASSVLAPLLVLAGSVSSKTVQISNGLSVEGGTCKTTAVNYFFSIPYAEPPVGELRYAPPQPPCLVSSHAVINATNPTPACIQFGTQFAEAGPQSEDW